MTFCMYDLGLHITVVDVDFIQKSAYLISYLMSLLFRSYLLERKTALSFFATAKVSLDGDNEIQHSCSQGLEATTCSLSIASCTENKDSKHQLPKDCQHLQSQHTALTTPLLSMTGPCMYLSLGKTLNKPNEVFSSFQEHQRGPVDGTMHAHQ